MPEILYFVDVKIRLASGLRFRPQQRFEPPTPLGDESPFEHDRLTAIALQTKGLPVS